MAIIYSFWPGVKALRVGLYVPAATHDQKTLPLQISAMRDYAKKRNWTLAIEVQDVASGATTRPPEGDAHRGGPTTRGRLRPGLATGSPGAVAGGPDELAARTDRPRHRVRLPVRSARPDDPERAGAGRNAGRVRRVRAGYFCGIV